MAHQPRTRRRPISTALAAAATSTVPRLAGSLAAAPFAPQRYAEKRLEDGSERWEPTAGPSLTTMASISLTGGNHPSRLFRSIDSERNHGGELVVSGRAMCVGISTSIGTKLPASMKV